ncbi:hypothetical protein DVH24_002185 [Malus domestica]|uniref:Strictosidine synthase conserved region domain-containing protein n=1 Tax=Malus domestica TaxID=3750 RepID=A0A498I9J5_MALDO|nr:hypothetical protein DVH24_002185 [Malus domestica]
MACREREIENRLEEFYVLFSSPHVFIYSNPRRISYLASNTKFNRKDLLDPEGFLIYLYLGFTQSHMSENVCAKGIDSTTNKQWKHEKKCVVGPLGGLATSLSTHVGRKPILYANDLDIHKNGSIFFTDTCKRYNRMNHFVILLEGESTSRLLRYDPPTKTTQTM